MCHKGILGGEVVDAIDINEKTFYLTFHPSMMLIMLLMKGNKEFPISQCTSTLLRPLWYCVSGCISVCAMRQKQLTYKGTGSNIIWNMNGFKRSGEALISSIVYTEWFFGWLRINGSMRHINIRQEDNMIES